MSTIDEQLLVLLKDARSWGRARDAKSLVITFHSVQELEEAVSLFRQLGTAQS